jgi:hypothetical protein
VAGPFDYPPMPTFRVRYELFVITELEGVVPCAIWTFVCISTLLSVWTFTFVEVPAGSKSTLGVAFLALRGFPPFTKARNIWNICLMYVLRPHGDQVRVGPHMTNNIVFAKLDILTLHGFEHLCAYLHFCPYEHLPLLKFQQDRNPRWVLPFWLWGVFSLLQRPGISKIHV